MFSGDDFIPFLFLRAFWGLEGLLGEAIPFRVGDMGSTRLWLIWFGTVSAWSKMLEILGWAELTLVWRLTLRVSIRPAWTPIAIIYTNINSWIVIRIYIWDRFIRSQITWPHDTATTSLWTRAPVKAQSQLKTESVQCEKAIIPSRISLSLFSFFLCSWFYFVFLQINGLIRTWENSVNHNTWNCWHSRL